MFQENHLPLLKNLIDFILIILVISNPLFYGSVTVLGYTYIEIVVFFCVFLWILEMLLQKKIKILKVRLIIPFLFFLFLIIFQIILLPEGLLKVISPHTVKFYREFLPSDYLGSAFSLSICRETTIIYFFKFLSYFLVFFLIINHIQTKEQFKKIYNTIILAGLIITILAIIQNFKGGRLFKDNFLLGIFINRNHLAGYLEMIIPLTFGYFLSETKLIFKSFYLMGIFVMSLGLILTLSRAGLIIYIFSIIILVSILINKARYFMDLNLKALICILVLLIFLLSFMVDFKLILNRVISIFGSSAFERGYSTKDILKIWLDFPLFGTGLGTFADINSKYKSSHFQMIFIYAHNDYLQLLIETGIIGFLFVFLFFYLYFFSFFKMWRKRHDRFVIGISSGSIISIVAILIHSLIDFNLHIPTNALLFFIILALNYKLIFSNFRIKDGLSSEDLA